jgi:hypothetical protein
VYPGSNVPGAVQYPEGARAQLAAKGSPAADATPEAASSPYFGPLDTKDYWSWRSVGIGVGICVVVFAVLGSVLFVIPFSHSFSGVAITENGMQPYVLIPHGAPVKGNWHSVSGAPVTFQIILASNNTAIYNVTAVSGSFAFTSVGPGYYFCTYWVTGGSATFSGSYQAPLY